MNEPGLFVLAREGRLGFCCSAQISQLLLMNSIIQNNKKAVLSGPLSSKMIDRKISFCGKFDLS